MAWFEVNLAAINYLKVISPEHGPITRVAVQEIENGYESYAYLHPDFRIHEIQNQLYGNCDGTGFAKSKSESIYIAISEAIERWAFYKTPKELNHQFGFDIDNTTNGMAAFPSLTTKNVRKHALFESIERWTLISWWLEKLKPTYKTNESIVFQITDPKCFVVIVWKKSEKNIYSYGFACSETQSKATKKSLIELDRNERVLTKSALMQNDDQFSVQEKRLKFFSKANGHQNFLDKIKISNKQILLPDLLIDSELKGPWTKYAKVWRCLYPSEYAFEKSADENFFMF